MPPPDELLWVQNDIIIWIFLESAPAQSTLTGEVHRSYKHIVHLSSCRTYHVGKKKSKSNFLLDLFLNLTVKKSLKLVRTYQSVAISAVSNKWMNECYRKNCKWHPFLDTVYTNRAEQLIYPANFVQCTIAHIAPDIYTACASEFLKQNLSVSLLRKRALRGCN